MSTVEMVWQPKDGPEQTVTVLGVTAPMLAAIEAAVQMREDDPSILTLPHVVVDPGHAPEKFIFRAWRVLSYRVVAS